MDSQQASSSSSSRDPSPNRTPPSSQPSAGPSRSSGLNSSSSSPNRISSTPSAGGVPLPLPASIVRQPSSANIRSASPSAHQPTFDEVKRDLHSALTFIRDLREENDSFRANFAILKEQYILLQRTCQDLQENKSMLEKAHLEQVMSWQAQLEEKAKEFDQVRQQLSNLNDLESLRQQLVEEAEMRATLQKELEEADKYRTAFVELRRTHELMRTDYEHQIVEGKRILEELQRESEANIREVTSRNIQLQEQLQDTSESDALRAAQKEVAQLSITNKRLMDEIEDVRREKEKLRVDKEEVVRMTSKQVAEEMTKSRALSAEVDRLTRKVNALQESVESSHRLQEAMQSANVVLEKKNHELHVQLDESNAHSLAERNTARQMLTDREREWQRDKEFMQKQHEDLTKRIEELAASNSELQNKLSSTERELGTRIRQARDEEAQKTRLADNRTEALQRQLDDLQRSSAHEVATLNQEMERLRKELQAARVDKQTAEAEKQGAVDKLAKNSASLQQMKSALEQSEQREEALNQKCIRLQQEHESKEQERSSAISVRERLELTIEYLQRDITALQSELENLRQGHGESMDHSKRNWDKEKNVLLERVSQLESAVVNARAEVEQTKRMMKKYKSKYASRIADLQQQIQICNAKMSAFDAEKQGMQQSHALEKSNLEHKLKEAERTRDRLQFMLSGSEDGSSAATAVFSPSASIGRQQSSLDFIASSASSTSLSKLSSSSSLASASSGGEMDVELSKLRVRFDALSGSLGVANK